jgi:hypothetical protein
MALLISDIDHALGVVTLSDGTRWQVGPGDAGTIAGWSPGRPAAVVRAGPTRRLRCPADGPEALVCPAAGARAGAGGQPAAAQDRRPPRRLHRRAAQRPGGA